MTTLELLQRHPNTATLDQIKRFLRRARAYQVSEAGRAMVLLLLAEVMLDAGQVSEAYDLLTSVDALGGEQGGQTVDFRRQLMLGQIRHRQWREVMEGALATRGPSQGGTQGDLHGWDGYSHSTEAWGKAGRNGKQLCEEAQGALRRALQFKPGHTPAALLQMQLHLAQGKRKDALAEMRRQCQEAPLDGDTHAAYLMLLISESSTSGGGQRRRGPAPDSVREEMVRACCDRLRCCPGCEQTAKGKSCSVSYLHRLQG